jgi:hypothetical protein
MTPVSRGFIGRRPEVESVRVPPGQYVTDDFPVSAGGAGGARSVSRLATSKPIAVAGATLALATARNSHCWCRSG